MQSLWRIYGCAHIALALKLLRLRPRPSGTVAVLHKRQEVGTVAGPDLRNGHWVEDLRLRAPHKAAGAALGSGLLHCQTLRQRHHTQRDLRLPHTTSSHIDPALFDVWIEDIGSLGVLPGLH